MTESLAKDIFRANQKVLNVHLQLAHKYVQENNIELAKYRFRCAATFCQAALMAPHFSQAAVNYFENVFASIPQYMEGCHRSDFNKCGMTLQTIES